MSELDDGIEVDQHAMNMLVILFRRCAKEGISIPADLPLATPPQQRAACLYLGKALHTYYMAQRHDEDGWPTL